jgi:CHRD domain/Prealbumin-like fold domain
LKLARVTCVAIALFVSTAAFAQTFVFHLRGDQEVPPVPSTASGGCLGVLDQPAAQFSLTCVHNVVGATVMHIHRGAAGTNGSIAFDMGDPTSPVTATWTGMSPADIAELLAGNLYLNIHTAGRPAGEIRGQILPRTVDTVPFTAEGGQAVPPNDSSATANCTADLNDAATSLAVSCTHNVAAADAAHIHEAPFGHIGPIVFTFASAASPLNANVPMTPQLVADFAATFLYLDIHAGGGSEEDPADEIRGQIGTPPAGAGTGTIVIEKLTYPSGGTGFQFSETITPGNFTLDHGGTRTFSNVDPGTYTVTETAPAGSSVASLTCDDANSSNDAYSRTATVRLEAGETVRCTFENLASAPTDQQFVFHLSGDQEVPPVTTDERGGCMALFNAGTSTLSLVCVHDVELPTVMHIHRGAAGTNGPIAFDMGEPTSPVVATWSGMTPADVADLLAGNLYLNIHTAGRPAGVIRGQILPRTVDMVAFNLDASQVVPPGESSATGSCTADLSNDATQLAVSCTHNLASPDAAHVHNAPRGENGPVAFTFPSAASPINANVPLTPRAVADFAAYFLYVDVHGAGGSEESPGDQIRGQIGVAAAAVTTGTIHIVKQTSPAGGTDFAFADNITGSPGAFTLDHGETRTFTNIPAGTFTVTEADPTSRGYTLTDVVCSDGDSTGNPFARNATIRLAAGETVTCTFRNLQTLASPSQQFVFHLSGDQEVPPNNSTARGGCYGQLDSAARRMSLVCTHNVVGAAIAHIHRGAPGVNGEIVFDLGDPQSPIEAVWEDIAPSDLADLLAGNLYVNIHTSGRPGGEIRGQLVPRSIDNFVFGADGSQEVPPTDSTNVGACSANLADNAQSVYVECRHTVPAPTMIHLHAAPPGHDGPVVFDFPVSPAAFSGHAPLSPRLIADFAAGFLYVNIHSANYETGEIRGQLIPGIAPAIGAAGAPTLGEWALIAMMIGVALVALLRIAGYPNG